MRSSNNLNNWCCTRILPPMRRTLPPLVPGIDAFAEFVKVFLVRHSVLSFRGEWDCYEM